MRQGNASNRTVMTVAPLGEDGREPLSWASKMSSLHTGVPATNSEPPKRLSIERLRLSVIVRRHFCSMDRVPFWINDGPVALAGLAFRKHERTFGSGMLGKRRRRETCPGFRMGLLQPMSFYCFSTCFLFRAEERKGTHQNKCTRHSLSTPINTEHLRSPCSQVSSCIHWGMVLSLVN